jgi:hypothetical protein
MFQWPVILSEVDREAINAVEGSAVAFLDAGNEVCATGHYIRASTCVNKAVQDRRFAFIQIWKNRV